MSSTSSSMNHKFWFRWLKLYERLKIYELGISGSNYMSLAYFVCLAKCMHSLKCLWTAEAMLQLSQPEGASKAGSRYMSLALQSGEI